MSDTKNSDSYQFVLCENCLASLAVGGSWPDGVKIQCDACGNVQKLDTEDEQTLNTSLDDYVDLGELARGIWGTDQLPLGDFEGDEG